MRHRIARLIRSLLRLKAPAVKGSTVHHAGSRPWPTTPPGVVLGVGVGSIGLPAVIVGGTK